MRASVVAERGLSSRGTWALECRFSSCGAQALLLHSMWDLPGPGIKPMSPALAGGFLTTVPPGKSLPLVFNLPQKRDHTVNFYGFPEHHEYFKIKTTPFIHMNTSSMREETFVGLFVLCSIPRVWRNAWYKTDTLKILLMIE